MRRLAYLSIKLASYVSLCIGFSAQPAGQSRQLDWVQRFRLERQPHWLARWTRHLALLVRGHRRRSELLELQYAVLRQIAAGGLTQKSAQQICLMVEQLEPGATCTLVRLEEGEYLRSLAAPSLPTTYSGAIDGLKIGPAAGSCGTAMWRRQPVTVTDIHSDPLWHQYQDVARAFELRACYSTPVFSSSGQVLGSFAVYYRTPTPPSPNVIDAIDVAVELAAIALERELMDNTLSVSRTRLELAVRVARVAFWQHDFTTGRSYWSPEFRQMLDLDADTEPSQSEGYSRIVPEDLPRVRNAQLNTVRTGRPSK